MAYITTSPPAGEGLAAAAERGIVCTSTGERGTGLPQAVNNKAKSRIEFVVRTAGIFDPFSRNSA
jgi:hypothetical protein